MDFLYRPLISGLDSAVTFSRMGFVDEHSARIVLRAPRVTTVHLEYRPRGSTEWTAHQVQSLQVANDFTATYKLDGLDPETLYDYRTNASHTGSFVTSQVNRKRWSMIASSCIKPGFPYNPVADPLRIHGLEHVSDYLKTKKAEFMLFLGDFIYVDLPLNLGQKNEDYRRAYRQVYKSSSWSEVLWSLPFLHTYDDHEFQNDWASNTSGIFQQAVEPFYAYQGQANPEPIVPGHSYFSFERGDVSFFVLDARRYRDDSSRPDGPDKTMLGAEQLEALLSWIRNTVGVKVVVSSVPFTRNWRGAEEHDSWAGYLYEREKILTQMWSVGGGIIISGDRHEHATTEFPSPDGTANVIEFSTSPLSQFYQPFVRSYQQVEDTDIEIYSHPKGTSKFGALHFDTSGDIVHVAFELVVDGGTTWNRTFDLHAKRWRY
ncbi:Metallo-dependent phosphatase [Aureobasidium subglaciale]|nr:Metallo-dependent phosphatase [Aureobasidium subglaciale]